MNSRNPLHRAGIDTCAALTIAALAGCFMATEPVPIGDLTPGVPITLADDQVDPFDLVVDGTHVYWMDWLVTPPVGWMGTEARLTTLMKVDKAGTTDPEIFDHVEHQGSSANPAVIAMDSGDIYWTDTWGHFRKTDKATGTGTDVSITSERASAVVVDATHVYWLNSSLGELVRYEKSTSTLISIVSGLGNIGTRLALDGTNLYWIQRGSGFGEDAIVTFDVAAGGMPTEIVSSLPISDFTIDANTIYFTSVNSIYSVAKSGGTPTVEAADISPFTELVVDATHVYWGDGDRDEDGVSVFRMLKTDGSIVAMATELEAVTDLALDSTHIYWTDRDAGQVIKLSK